MTRQTFNRPLALLVLIGLVVYGTIALEIYALAVGAWSGMFLLLAIVVATAVGLAVGFSRLLDEGSPAPTTEPELAPVPQPVVATVPTRRRVATGAARPVAPLGA
jgi:hypothetical protein